MFCSIFFTAMFLILTQGLTFGTSAISRTRPEHVGVGAFCLAATAALRPTISEASLSDTGASVAISSMMFCYHGHDPRACSEQVLEAVELA